MITRYAVYDAATGGLIRWGDCLDSDVERQALRPGEAARRLPGDFDPDNIPTLEELDAQ